MSYLFSQHVVLLIHIYILLLFVVLIKKLGRNWLGVSNRVGGWMLFPLKFVYFLQWPRLPARLHRSCVNFTAQLTSHNSTIFKRWPEQLIKQFRKQPVAQNLLKFKIYASSTSAQPYYRTQPVSIVKMEGKPAPAKRMRISSELDHHQRYNYCRTRSNYRAGRNLTAVKVRHLILIE